MFTLTPTLARAYCELQSILYIIDEVLIPKLASSSNSPQQQPSPPAPTILDLIAVVSDR